LRATTTASRETGEAEEGDRTRSGNDAASDDEGECLLHTCTSVHGGGERRTGDTLQRVTRNLHVRMADRGCPRAGGQGAGVRPVEVVGAIAELQTGEVDIDEHDRTGRIGRGRRGR